MLPRFEVPDVRALHPAGYPKKDTAGEFANIADEKIYGVTAMNAKNKRILKPMTVGVGERRG